MGKCIKRNGMSGKKLALVVGGGPAPGINGVISSATIEALNHGLEVYGIIGGFKSLFEGKKDSFIPLTIEDVSRIHTQGGSILKTSRDRPENVQERFKTLISTLYEFGISYLMGSSRVDLQACKLGTGRRFTTS
jgi:6-phosphofructokinase